MLSCTIIVKKRIFFNDQTHYAIVKAISADKANSKEVTFKGVLDNCTEGAKYAVKGYMEKDFSRPTEPYFKVKHAEFQEQTSTEGWVEYLLREGPNLGDIRAKELVGLFGSNVVQVLANEPDKAASSIKGLNPERLKELSEWAREELLLSDTKKLLYSLQFTPGVVRKLVMKFGRKTTQVIKSDPFLTTEVDGIGFITASKIAEKVGCPATDPRRIRCGILHVMETHAEEGHICIYGDTLIFKAQKLLGVSRELITQVIKELIDKQTLCTNRTNPRPFAKNPDLFPET